MDDVTELPAPEHSADAIPLKIKIVLVDGEEETRISEGALLLAILMALPEQRPEIFTRALAFELESRHGDGVLSARINVSRVARPNATTIVQ